MTQQHIIYIPTIFLLGLVIGLILGDRKASKNEHMETFNHKKEKKRVLYSFLFFAIVFITTHIYDLPYNSKNVSRLLGHQEIFDKSPVFTSGEFYQKISTFSIEGINAYMRFTYTSDLIFPLAFLIFILSFYRYMKYKSSNTAAIWDFLKALPYLWFASDLLENLLIFSILNYYPIKLNLPAGSVGIITVIKFTLLFCALIAPVITFTYSKFKTSSN